MSEKVGLPNSKTRNLIERVLELSTNDGDLVADFCGSGTTAAVAEKIEMDLL